MIARVITAALIAVQSANYCEVLAQTASQKPILLIVHSENCLPCRQFAAAWRERADFRTRLQNRFDVRSLNWSNPAERSTAMKHGVTLLPSFVAQRPDGTWARPIAGYRDTPEGRADLIAALRDIAPDLPAARDDSEQRSAPVTAPKSRTTREESRTREPVSTVDREARQQLQSLSQQQDRLGDEVNSLKDSVERSLTESRRTTEQLSQVRSDVTALRGDIGKTSQTLSRQMSEVSERTRSETTRELNSITERMQQSVSQTITERLKEIPRDIPTLPHFESSPPLVPQQTTGHGVSGWLLKLGLTGAAAYFGLPIAGAGVAAGVVGWLVSRRRKRRQPAAGDTAADRVTVLRDEVTRKTTDNHYVVKETDRVGEAYKESIRRTCAAYKNDKPGIVDVARQIEHVANELLRGQDVTARAAKAPRPGIWDDSSEGI